MLYPRTGSCFPSEVQAGAAVRTRGRGLQRPGRVGRGSGDTEDHSFVNSESAPLCNFFQENLFLQNTDQQGGAADPWQALYILPTVTCHRRSSRQGGLSYSQQKGATGWQNPRKGKGVIYEGREVRMGKKGLCGLETPRILNHHRQLGYLSKQSGRIRFCSQDGLFAQCFWKQCHFV